MGSIIEVYPKKGVIYRTPAIWQWDAGDMFHVNNVDLPASYKAEFSNEPIRGVAKPRIQTSDTIAIPSEYQESGEPIYTWLVVVDEMSRTTEYALVTPVKGRSKNIDQEPAPEEQSVIDQAIAALNTAVETTGQNAEAAAGAAEFAEDSAELANQYMQAAQTAQEAAETARSSAEGHATDAAASAQAAARSTQTAAQNAQDASQSAISAEQSKTAVQTAKEAAESAKSIAESAAQTATLKAGEASQSAHTAIQKAQEAASYALETGQLVDDAKTAKTGAEEAKEEAVAAQNMAETAAGNASANALKAEGYAVGKQNGTDAETGQPYHHDNAKWYKEQAQSSAQSAKASEDAAEAAAEDAQVVVLVQDEEPEETGNKVWIKEDSYTETLVPTLEEYTELTEAVEDCAQETTATDIKALVQNIRALVQQIAEDGTGSGEMNGFSLTLGAGGEVVLSYVNPDDETDTAEAVMPTNSTQTDILSAMQNITENLKLIAGGAA